MSFASPKMFVWLIAIPAVIWWYVAAQHRRAARAEALAEEVTADDIIARVLQAIPAPEVAPRADGRKDRDEQQWMPRPR